MKIPKNKFIINHKYNSNSNNSYTSNKFLMLKIFYITSINNNNSKTVTVTAAVMILMQAIVSVNTTHNVLLLQPETDMNTVATTTDTRIRAKNQFDLNKNPVKIQKQQLQLLCQSTITKCQQTQSLIPPKSLSLNPYHLSNAETKTLTQTSPTSVTKKRTTTAISGQAGRNGVCKYLNGAWGDVDPNIFYICDTQTNKPLQLRCPKGRGFFLGLGFSGCIPYEQWPDCIASRHHEQVEICDSEHMQQPWETVNPNKFYVCLKESIEPAILSCETGKGFVHTIVTTSGGFSYAAARKGVYSEIVGCANWEKWRNYMQCNDYY